MSEEELIVEPIVDPVVPEVPIGPTPEEIAAKRISTVSKTEGLLEVLSPLMTVEQGTEARTIANRGNLSNVLQYLSDSVPEVSVYLGKNSRMRSSGGYESEALGSSEDEDEKIRLIKEGLTERAEGMVPDYEMPPPFLGNEIEEARGKQEDAGTRYATQYGQAPFVQPVFRGRSAVDNPYYERPVQRQTYRYPIKKKSARLKLF